MMRKKALFIAKEDLTSSLRKQTSAPDNRPSSTAIGSIGAAMISCIVVIVILPDMISGVYQFQKIMKKCIAINGRKSSRNELTKVV